MTELPDKSNVIRRAAATGLYTVVALHAWLEVTRIVVTFEEIIRDEIKRRRRRGRG